MADVANVPAQPILNVGTDRICVRKATKSDTTAILRNHAITMEEHIERERDFTETTPFAEKYLGHAETFGARLKSALSRRRVIVLVAEIDGTAAAHLIYQRHRGWMYPIMALVNDISVTPGHRNKGLGSALIQHMELAECNHATPMTAATIWPDNQPSQAFFESLGYDLEQTPPTSPLKGHWIARKECALSPTGYALIWARTFAVFSPLFALPPLVAAFWG